MKVSKAQIQEQPQHQHDSESCIFMGSYETHDLWFNPVEKSVIARFGIDGDYHCVTSDLFEYILEQHKSFGGTQTRASILEAIFRAKMFKFI